MSLTYTGAGGLFTELGQLIKYVNVHVAAQTAYATERDAIMSQFDGSDVARGYVDGLYSAYGAFPNQDAGKASTLKRFSDRVLAGLQEPLFCPSSNPAVILPYLYTQMVTDGYKVTAIVPTAVAITPAGTNTSGGATLVASMLLPASDGVSGGNDQRVQPETLKALCTSDLVASTRIQFQIQGQQPSSPFDGVSGYGSGSINLYPADMTSIINNGQFDNWDTSSPALPVGWELTQNATNTNFCESAGGGLRSHSALRINGDSTITALYASQVVSLQVAQPYLFSVWLKKGGTLPTGSTLKIEALSGPVDVVLFNADPADPSKLTTSYVNYKAVVNLSQASALTLAINIELTGAGVLGTGNYIFVADMILTPMTVLGHVAYAFLPGTANNVINDNWGVVTALTGTPGVIQSFFSRFYNFQLPTTGATLIADSLAV
jgi:hypothetical protein